MLDILEEFLFHALLASQNTVESVYKLVFCYHTNLYFGYMCILCMYVCVRVER